MRSVLVLVIVGATRAASAAPCEGLHGDAALVSAVGDLLVQRNVSCGDLRGEIRQDGSSIVVTREDAVPVERRVADLATAATVIESWSVSTVTDPLLVAHPIPVVASAEPAAEPPPRVVVVERQLPPSTFHGSQLFAAAETSVGDDRTTWAGGQIGACVVIGPICAEASARFANVVDGPALSGLDRRSIEVLIGGDVPINVGRGLLLLGFGGGTGQVHTRVDSRDDHRMASETGGLRAEVHAAYAYPLTRAIAVDATFSLDLTQATRSEKTTPTPLPDEPLLLARFGIGLRWGHLQ